MTQKTIGIGIIGGGYMGKRHAVAFAAVGAVFNTALRPRLAMVCATTPTTAARYQRAYGFADSCIDWRQLVACPQVDAVVIASPQATHYPISLASFAAGKHVLCEKPLGISVEQSQQMALAAQQSQSIHMVGFNYIRTPASQMARRMIARGDLGQIVYFRGEHTEDFFAGAKARAGWRTVGRENGTMNDLAPHMINAALALVGPIEAVMADIEIVHEYRPLGNTLPAVDNDDQGHFICRFSNGVMGYLHFSRVALGRKMGYAYHVTGTEGALFFDQEDQNALWYYRCDDPPEVQGFKKILTNTAHPDYLAFCQGAGHGTGYQDQIIIQARDFLHAIEINQSIWPNFADGYEVDRVIEAAHRSSASKRWQVVARE